VPHWSYGDTREDALTHIENAISLILEKMKLNGMLLPSNEPASGGVLLNIMIE
jgi:predicted RNase H-like HicB family nuclease